MSFVHALRNPGVRRLAAASFARDRLQHALVVFLTAGGLTAAIVPSLRMANDEVEAPGFFLALAAGGAATMLLMFAPALTASAVWLMVAHRTMRDAALAIINGATGAQVRAVVVRVALITFAISLVIALPLAFVIESQFSRPTDGRVLGFVAVPVLFGFVAFLASAIHPARLAERLPALSIANGRHDPDPGVGSKIVLGLFLGVLGLGAFSLLVTGPPDPIQLVLGFVGIVSVLGFGVALSAAGLMFLTVFLDGESIVLRLIARDWRRHTVRAASSTAALMMVFLAASLFSLDSGDWEWAVGALLVTVPVSLALSALVGAQAESDLAMVVALGGSPEIRQRYLSTQAFLQSATALVAAVFLFLLVVNTFDEGPPPDTGAVFPTMPAVLILLLVPVITAAVVDVFSRERVTPAKFG